MLGCRDSRCTVCSSGRKYIKANPQSTFARHSLEAAGKTSADGIRAWERVKDELENPTLYGLVFSKFLADCYKLLQKVRCSPVREELLAQFIKAYKTLAEDGGEYIPRKEGLQRVRFECLEKVRCSELASQDAQLRARVVVGHKRKRDGTLKSCNEDYAISRLVFNVRK